MNSIGFAKFKNNDYKYKKIQINLSETNMAK